MKANTSNGRVRADRRGDTLVVCLSGDWALADGLLGFEDHLDLGTNGTGVRTVAFDASDLEAWDSSLLTFLVQGLVYCEAHGIEFQAETLPGNVQGLIDLSRAVPEKDVGEAARPSWLSRVGTWSIALAEEARSITAFTGSVVLSLGRFLGRRTRLRWRDFWVQVQATGPRALPIVTLISFLVGLIISFLGAVVLRKFGAEIYNAYLVGYGVLRELGALMTGIIMAGRTGAAFAAEIGSMRVSGEIDALQTLGISPIDFIVLPRILALFIMMPLLTLYADAIGILGGMLISNLMLDLGMSMFITIILSVVDLSDFLLGLGKGVLFGGLIAVSGCLRGMQTGGSAQAVGEATTSAVVTGITLIILVNAVVDWLAALFNI